MNFGSFRRLFSQDFDEQYRVLVDKLSVTINNSFESIFNGLSHKLSLRDNFYTSIQDIQVSIDSTGKVSLITPFTLTNGVTKIEGLSVLNATNTKNPLVYPTGAPFISYNQSGSTITINNITGLPNSNTFLLRVVAWGNSD